MWDKGNTVETVALLTRKKDAERIDIEMNVDREDVTGKATYQKINMKYIADVKRNHGLPMLHNAGISQQPMRRNRYF